MKQRRDGFTLAELLVVITIIGILAAIVIPTLIIGPRNAKLMACKSNLQEISKNLQSYRASHQGPPPVRGGQEAATWGEYLKDNGRGSGELNNKLFFCPLMERMSQASAEAKRSDDGDYMYNLSVNGMNALSSAVDADTPLIADCVKDEKTSNHADPSDIGINVIMKNGSAKTVHYREGQENLFTTVMKSNMVGGSNTGNPNCASPSNRTDSDDSNDSE